MSVHLDPALPRLVVDTLASLFGQVNAQSHAFTGQLVNAFSLAERWMIACPLEGWVDADRNALVGLLHTHLRSDSAAKGCLSDAASRRPQSEKDASGKALESLEWCITENGIWLDMPTRRRPQAAEEWAVVAAKASQMGGVGVLKAVLAASDAPPISDLLGQLSIPPGGTELPIAWEPASVTGWSWVVRHATPEIVTAWLAGGADPNALDKEGRPVLAHAVSARTVAALLDAGADPLGLQFPWPARKKALEAIGSVWSPLVLMGDKGTPRIRRYLENRLAQWVPEERAEGGAALHARATRDFLMNPSAREADVFLTFTNALLGHPPHALAPAPKSATGAPVFNDPRSWTVWQVLTGVLPDAQLPLQWASLASCLTPDAPGIPLSVWAWACQARQDQIQCPAEEEQSAVLWGEGLARLLGRLWDHGTATSVTSGLTLLGGVVAGRWASRAPAGCTFAEVNAAKGRPMARLKPHVPLLITQALRAVWSLYPEYRSQMSGIRLSAVMGHVAKLPQSPPEVLIMILACPVAGPRRQLHERLRAHLVLGWAPDPTDETLAKAVGALAASDPAIHREVLAACLNSRLASAPPTRSPRL